MSYATILIPGSGIHDAYLLPSGQLNADELNSAVGIYLATWFIFTCLMLCVPFRISFYGALGC